MYGTAQNAQALLMHHAIRLYSKQYRLCTFQGKHVPQPEIIMMKKIFASLLATLFLASTVLTLSACNTVEGAGKDIEKGGQAIKNEANEHKN